MSADRGRGRGIVAPTVIVLAISLIATACGGPILARPAAPTPGIPAPTPSLTPPDDPQPIVLPRDDGPHERLTEWWYYTGHLTDQHGGTWGFQYVIFRAERGDFPVSWASHFAITDEANGAFHYAQRSAIGPRVDRSPIGSDGEPIGFDLAVVDFGAAPAGSGIPPWTMVGGGGTDRLDVVMSEAEWQAAGIESGFVLDLALSTDRPAALHDEDGWIDFGPAGGSYYYSRTRMDASGRLSVGDRDLRVEGIAWFDHQWGDFIAVGGGGWDWFAVNLDDGTDLTVSSVRDATGSAVLVYGTLVEADGRTRHLPPGSVSVVPTGSWRSDRTGANYPAGWQLDVPAQNLVLELAPTVADQELDTRATTGVIYWEGSQRVSGRRDGVPIQGRGYVELTGYAN